MKTLQELTRPNIWKLKPYSSARDEYKGAVASVFLDANENPYNLPHNRYPDPMQWELKTLLSKIKKVSPQHIFLGNGSDEAIDLVFRAFCEPEKDNVVAIDPTYGMYQVCADVNDVEYRKVLLDDDFQFSADKLLAATDEHTKLIFLCSPNNPTGNDLLRSEIEKILCQFEGLVMLDEAYNDFSKAPSFLEELDKYPNLVVFQTFSKAWGCAAIRLGMAFASKEIIDILSKIKYPYNVNQLTIKFTRPEGGLFTWIELPEGISARDVLVRSLEKKIAFVPGGSFYPNGNKENTLRINYSNMPEDKIEKGLKTLGEVVGEYISQSK